MTRKMLIPVMLGLISLAACSDGEKAAEPEVAETVTTDSIGELVSRVRGSSRLYSSEYQVRKLVSYDDVRRLKGSVFGQKFDIRLPQGDRKVLIPVEAVIKGYVDFGDFSKDNVRIDSGRVTVILPDPVVEVTSTKIDHENIKEYVSFTRPAFSQAELSMIEKQGRASIVAAIPRMGILDDTRRSASDMIWPMLMAMGYEPEAVSVIFRSDFTPEEYADRIVVFK